MCQIILPDPVQTAPYNPKNTVSDTESKIRYYVTKFSIFSAFFMLECWNDEQVAFLSFYKTLGRFLLRDINVCRHHEMTQICFVFIALLLGYNIKHRGGVEDTRLEAKAKDTKKSEAKAKDSLSEDRHSRGQGQECSRQRPRTKDTSASALQKKRSSQKFFRRSPKKSLHKNFSSDLHKKTFSKKFFNRSTKF